MKIKKILITILLSLVFTGCNSQEWSDTSYSDSFIQKNGADEYYFCINGHLAKERLNRNEFGNYFKSSRIKIVEKDSKLCKGDSE